MVLLVAVGITVLCLLGGSLWLRYGRPAADAETFCPAAGPVTVTAVLVDATDPFTPVQAEAVRRRVDEVIDSVPTGGAFELYAVAPTEFTPLDPLVALCNPGRADETNVWTSNPRRVGLRWRDRFAAPLEDALARGLHGDAARSSPILEFLQSLAVTAFSGRGRTGKPHRLVLVSDLLQHSQVLSLYKGIDRRFLDSPGFARSRPDLADAEVQILYINRVTSRPLQGADHLRFWLDLLAAAGGRVTQVDRL